MQAVPRCTSQHEAQYTQYSLWRAPQYEHALPQELHAGSAVADDSAASMYNNSVTVHVVKNVLTDCGRAEVKNIPNQCGYPDDISHATRCDVIDCDHHDDVMAVSQTNATTYCLRNSDEECSFERIAEVGGSLHQARQANSVTFNVMLPNHYDSQLAAQHDSQRAAQHAGSSLYDGCSRTGDCCAIDSRATCYESSYTNIVRLPPTPHLEQRHEQCHGKPHESGYGAVHGDGLCHNGMAWSQIPVPQHVMSAAQRTLAAQRALSAAHRTLEDSRAAAGDLSTRQWSSRGSAVQDIKGARCDDLLAIVRDARGTRDVARADAYTPPLGAHYGHDGGRNTVASLLCRGDELLQAARRNNDSLEDKWASRGSAVQEIRTALNPLASPPQPPGHLDRQQDVECEWQVPGRLGDPALCQPTWTSTTDSARHGVWYNHLYGGGCGGSNGIDVATWVQSDGSVLCANPSAASGTMLCGYEMHCHSGDDNMVGDGNTMARYGYTAQHEGFRMQQFDAAINSGNSTRADSDNHRSPSMESGSVHNWNRGVLRRRNSWLHSSGSTRDLTEITLMPQWCARDTQWRHAQQDDFIELILDDVCCADAAAKHDTAQQRGHSTMRRCASDKDMLLKSMSSMAVSVQRWCPDGESVRSRHSGDGSMACDGSTPYHGATACHGSAASDVDCSVVLSYRARAQHGTGMRPLLPLPTGKAPHLAKFAPQHDLFDPNLGSVSMESENIPPHHGDDIAVSHASESFDDTCTRLQTLTSGKPPRARPSPAVGGRRQLPRDGASDVFNTCQSSNYGGTGQHAVASTVACGGIVDAMLKDVDSRLNGAATAAAVVAKQTHVRNHAASRPFWRVLLSALCFSPRDNAVHT